MWENMTNWFKYDFLEFYLPVFGSMLVLGIWAWWVGEKAE